MERIVKGALLLVLMWPIRVFPMDTPYTPGPGKYPRFQAKEAEPGLTYGKADGFELPKTILFSLSPDELAADAETWIDHGFQAFFLTGAASEWSVDIWGTDGESWTIGSSDKTFQKVKEGVEICRRRGAEVFLTVAFSRYFEWFNDVAWGRIENNFRQFAIFARDTGCKGLALDIEYVWPQYHFSWDGYTYDGYSRKDLADTIRKRMTGVAKAIYDEFPDMVLLTFPEQSFSLGSHVHTAWIEEAARRDAPGGVHLCTEYTYRRPNIRYMFGHACMNNRLMQSKLSQRAWTYWRNRCSISAGLWPFGQDPEDYHGEAPNLDEFRQAFAASLMMSAKYNWIYSHNLRPFMLGRDLQGYGDERMREDYMGIIRDRAVVTAPKYLKVAADLRRMEVRDFSDELGLVVAASFAGPREEGEVGLFPKEVYSPSLIASAADSIWKLGLRLQRGEELDLRKEFGTQTRWLLVGPFDNHEKQGFHFAYPPEPRADPRQEYETERGNLKWNLFEAAEGRATVNLTEAFDRTEEVCAYALCYVSSETDQEVQIRVGANDSWKLWVGGELLRECPEEGRILLDREILPVRLSAGKTPVLLKVCNNKKDWGFIFRITDSRGKPARGLRYELEP
ncbi:MAG: hypothetical protein GHCLOJNM_02834 [bacterium]|nr:hypothetical protein [bacterium]